MGEVRADEIFGQGDASFDLLPVHGAIRSAVSAIEPVIAQHKVFFLSQYESCSPAFLLHGVSVGVFRQVWLYQHLPVDKDAATPKLDGFTRQSNDALDRIILFAVVQKHDVPSLKRR